MTIRWIKWDETPQGEDEKRIPYYAGSTFTCTIREGDDFSPKAAEYLGIELDINISVEDIILYFQQGNAVSIDYVSETLHTDRRNAILWMEKNGVIPPPVIPFDHVGHPVLAPDGNYEAVAKEQDWLVWATHRENGLVWVIEQKGTDRYWVNAADPGAGASVPGAGENVFFNDKASENGVWNATTHWSAATGSAAAGAYVCTMDVNSAALGTITQSYASATLAVVSYTLEHDGAGSFGGITTFTTGKIQSDGGATITGTMGSNTAYTIDAAAWVMSGSPTFNSPTGAGAMTVSGNLTGTTTMTWNQNGVTTILDGTLQTLSGFSDGTSTVHILGNVKVQTSTTLTINGSNFVGAWAGSQSVVLTFNMTGSIANGGSAFFMITSSNTNPIICTSMPTTFNDIRFDLVIAANANLPASTWTSNGPLYFRNTLVGILSLTGNVTITGTTAIKVYSESAQLLFTLAISTYTFDCSGATGIFTAGTSSNGGAITATTGTIKIGGTLTNTVDSNFTFGSNSNYTWTQTGSLNWTEGTLNLPNATGTATFAGTTWTEGGTTNANSGNISYTKAGTTTLGSAATSFYSVTVNAGTTLNTSAASSFAFTAASTTSITGSLLCNASTITAAAVTVNDGGLVSNMTATTTCTGDVLIGGGVSGSITSTTGTMTLKDLTIAVGATYTAPSTTTTITGETAGNIAWDNEGTFTHNSGKVDFQGQTSPYQILGDNLWGTLEITVTLACTYEFEGSHTQTVATYCRMNGAAGQLLTIDSTDANHWNLTLSGGCAQDFAYLVVDQSDALGGLQCFAAFSTDMTTNHNWVFGGASTFIWDGGGVGNLASTGGNWMGDVAPGIGADCLLDNSGTKSCTWDIASTSGNIQVASGYTGTITMNNSVQWSTFNIADGTLAVVATTVYTSSTFAQSGGIVSFTTGTLHADGDIALSGGTFGSNTAYTINADGAFTISGSPTFNSPTGAGAMNVYSHLTGVGTMTCNWNGVTTVLDGVNQSLIGWGIGGTATTSLSNLAIQTSTTLTVTSANWIGANTNCVLTFNMTGALLSASTGSFNLRSTNANCIIFTSAPTIWGGVTLYCNPFASYNFPAFTAVGMSICTIAAVSAGATVTQTGNWDISAFAIYEDSYLGTTTISHSTYTTTYAASSTIRLSNTGVINSTFTTGTINLTATNGIFISNASTFGSNSNYVLNIDSSFNVPASNTINLPNATGTCTMSGATWTEGGTVNADLGACQFDRVGTTTLGSNATSFYGVIILATTTFDTSASHYALSTIVEMYVNGGVLNTNNSTCQFGIPAYAADYGLFASGTVTAGSGIWTASTILLHSGTCALPTNGVTITGAFSGIGIGWFTATDFTGNSTVTFAYAGTDALTDYNVNGRAHTLYAVVINNAANIVRPLTASAVTLIITTTMTILSGAFNTAEAGGTSRSLTVTGATSITGTLTCNASTINMAACTINDGGLLSNMTATTTMSGNLIVGGGISGSLTTAVAFISVTGTTTINTGATLGSAGVGYAINMDGNLLASTGTFQASSSAGGIRYSGDTWLTPSTFVHNNGGIWWDRAGTTVLGNTSIGFYKSDIRFGATLDTQNFALTTANYMLLSNATSVLTCNNSTCSFGSGVVGITDMFSLNGTFNGGTGTHTMGTVSINWGSSMTFTSGTTTVNGRLTATDCFYVDTPLLFDHNNGTIKFTYAGLQEIYEENNDPITIYNLIVEKGAGNTLQYTDGQGCNLTCTGSLTVTSGTFDTNEETTGVSWNLTITLTSSITGTLTCNASTIIATGAVTVNAGGIWNVSTATTTIGTSIANAGTVNIGNGTVMNGVVAPKPVTNTNTWNWDNITVSLLDWQFDITTPGTGKTFTITGWTVLDAFTCTALDSLICTTVSTGIFISGLKDVKIYGTLTSTGALGTDVSWAGHRSFQILTATAQTTTFTTFAGLNATTAWNNGPDISIGNGAKMQMGDCTLLRRYVGMEGTTGWLLSKNHDGVANDWRYYGVMTTNTASVGYRAVSWTSSTNISIKNADVYGTAFNTEITLNEKTSKKSIRYDSLAKLTLAAGAHS